MTTTELIRPQDASKYPSLSETLAETIPLVGAVAGYGPPVILLAGPLVLFALMLAAPFAVLVTLIAAMLVAAAALVALTAAIVGAPYLLARRLRAYRAGRAERSRHAAHFVPARSTRVAA